MVTIVVSMGGSTALFLGASILSFVEVVYYFLVRPISNSILAKEKARENMNYKRKDKMGMLILGTYHFLKNITVCTV